MTDNVPGVRIEVKDFTDSIHAIMQDSQEILLVDYSGERPTARMESLGESPDLEKIPLRHAVTVGNDGQTAVEKLTEPVLVHAETVLVEYLSYSAHTPVTDDGMYPPSSNGWYGRIVADQVKARFIVQRIDDDEKYWLTIINPETLEIYESHQVHPFEIGPLQMRAATEYFYSHFTDQEDFHDSVIDNKQRRDALAILDEPAPTWEQLWHLTEEYDVDSLDRGESMRDALTHLVPANWPEHIREEYMAFLAWTFKKTPFDKDPVKMFLSLTPTPMLYWLLRGHIVRATSGIDQPNYVSEINNPPSRFLGAPQHEPMHQPWVMAQEKLAFHGLIPSQASEVATQWSKRLSEEGNVVTGLPVTRAMAKRSRKNWSERSILQHFELGIQTRPRVRALGLRSLIYIGSAHRWPHKHMAWKATLGELGTTPLHVQEVVVSNSQIEAVRRVRGGLRESVWYARSFNFITEIDMNLFFKNADKTRTLKQIQREFGHWKKKSAYSLTELDLKAIDSSSDRLLLADLESASIEDEYGLTSRELRRSLQKLVSENVVLLNYYGIERPYPARLVTISGEQGHVLGFAQAALRQLPISSVYFLEDGDAVIVMNIPPTQVDDMCSDLSEWAAERGVDMRIFTIGGYLSLRGTLFQRLWKDGQWDEDISAIISQVRVKPSRTSG